MRISVFWWGIIICVVIVLAFLHQYILNISRPLALYQTDAFFINFVFKHYIEIISSGNWHDISTLPMLYGYKNSLLLSDHFFVQFLLYLPIYLITKNFTTSFNLVVVLLIILSCISMYILTWHFTKRVLPSVLAAIIFVLNPFVFSLFPNDLNLLSLFWIPAIILSFEKALVKPSSKYTFLFFLFLTFQLLSSLYYSAYLTVILPIYMIVRIFQTKVSPVRLLNRGVVIGLMLFLLTIFINGFIYTQISQIKFKGSLEKTAELYSAWVSDWFFTSPDNRLYGTLREKTWSIAPDLIRARGYTEQNFFWGIVPLIIFLVSFWTIKNPTFQKLRWLFIGLLIFSLLLSFGPIIHITRQIEIPGLYWVIYYLNPLFQKMRSASRFGIFTFFFLALIVSLTLSEIIKRLKSRRSLVLSLLIIGLVLFEYWNKPWEFAVISDETRKFYSALNKQQNINVILELPIANDIPAGGAYARPPDLDAHYLLFATVLHSKKLFNGYSSFLPSEYLRHTEILSLNFPSASELNYLIERGVEGIVLHKDEFFSKPEYYRIKVSLISIGIPLVASTDSLALFDLTGLTKAP